MSTLYVLGAPDPEMAAIERLLTEAGERVTYALGPDGKRVHPGNAYAMAPLPEPLPWGGNIILIECSDAGPCPLDQTGHFAPRLLVGDMINEGDLYIHVSLIDHHRPGDPGYGRPPSEFLPASSIGKVVLGLAAKAAIPPHWRTICRPGNYYAGGFDGGAVCLSPGQDGSALNEADIPGLWAVIPSDIVLTAAADHCLAAAYRGECPGVDPDVLMRWRAESRATFQHRSVAAVLADIEAAMVALRAAPAVTIAGTAVADLGDTTVPEAPEAACRIGVPFFAVVSDRDGRRKQVLQAAPPEVISAWMQAHPGAYGDPARGFSGRYLTAGRADA